MPTSALKPAVLIPKSHEECEEAEAQITFLERSAQ